MRIREVLVNTLSNAVKFTPDGGNIRFETDDRPGEDDRHIVARYRIADTGVGMSEEFLKRVLMTLHRRKLEPEPSTRALGWAWLLRSSM